MHHSPQVVNQLKNVINSTHKKTPPFTSNAHALTVSFVISSEDSTRASRETRVTRKTKLRISSIAVLVADVVFLVKQNKGLFLVY